MTESEIKINAYKFVEKLIITGDFPSVEKEQKLKGSLEHLQFVDWSDKLAEGPVIQRQKASEINDEVLQISLDRKTYGFEIKDYPPFYKFIYELSQFNNLKSKVSIKFLRTQTLIWIIDVFQNNRARQDLLHYLYEKLEKEIKKVRYYYPILNLTIEEPFSIGNIKITYFTKEYFDKYWECNRELFIENEEVFDLTYRKYQGRVFVETEAFAESEKGEEISYELASLTSDIVVLLSPTIVHPDENCLIDLERRMPWESEFLSIESGKEYDLSITVSANRETFHISKEMVSSIENNMLFLFGKILNGNQRCEIDFLIVETVKMVARAIRETDLHLRISLLIIVIESIFLLAEENHKMEKKCKRRMCELLKPKGGETHQKLMDSLSNMYQVRHKMIHKSTRIYIEPIILSHFQINVVEVILQLLANNSRLQTKENLIRMLDTKGIANAE
ncbi:hypothetical protein F8C76_10220 [Flagellimonas olearia]|uniref:Apea-like HEPN domain-containing protein n=1 Tax=Flagellimonas olearia TaxID=552546 RepID=A0A6I1DY41_9FLAO|nr:hypothetical protein [Allomuricauda olearia]KAB7528237.1 hypothetical protein F8C76_10220 [Allomuricauda olearia]